MLIHFTDGVPCVTIYKKNISQLNNFIRNKNFSITYIIYIYYQTTENIALGIAVFSSTFMVGCKLFYLIYNNPCEQGR